MRINQPRTDVWSEFLNYSNLPFQRLPNVAREKMFISRPVIPTDWLLVNMFLWAGGWWLLVTDQVFCIAVGEDHSTRKPSLFNERTTGEDEGSPVLPLTRLTGGETLSH